MEEAKHIPLEEDNEKKIEAADYPNLNPNKELPDNEKIAENQQIIDPTLTQINTLDETLIITIVKFF